MTARQKQWNQDLRMEHTAAPFLDVWFYDRVFADRYERTNDLKEQYAGIDVKVYGKTDARKLKPICIDEKYKVYRCLNAVYPAPGFEISLLNKAGFVQDGWFANERAKTQIYATIGLSATVESVEELVSAD